MNAILHSSKSLVTVRLSLSRHAIARCLSTGPDPSEVIERWKYPVRGGQNLSQRYQRLEASLRGKEAYQQNIYDLSEQSGTMVSPTPHSSTNTVKSFRGFILPEEPKPPEPDECCMSGCTVCVHDLYQEALAEYNGAVTSLRTSLNGLHISEDEWPASIRTRSKVEKRKDVSLSAFEQFELELKERRTKQAEDLYFSSAKARKRQLPEAASIYEGLRWLLFSNR